MKLRLFATVDLSHNGCENIGVWEIMFPVQTSKGFDINPQLPNHMHWGIIKKYIEPLQKSGKCVIMQPNSLGWNDAINKDNVKDFYFAEKVNGRHIISIATETLIEEIKTLL